MGSFRNRTTAVRPPSPRQRDDGGQVLAIVLVFTVISSLVVLPLLAYQRTVLRANKVLSSKTARVEAVKAGLRIALADPVSLYQTCGDAGPTVPVSLSSHTMTGLPVNTKCYFLDYATATGSTELRYGLVATQVGSTIPAELKGTRFSPVNPSSATEWISATTVESETNKIWLPNLPTHALDRRAPVGYQMPAGFPTCTVYFPGTYKDAVTISGPAYFTSGVYYFENSVTLSPGADVVVGLGSAEGCSTDQDAAFYAVDAPATHNISGLGGTWVFGGGGRLAVTNSTGTGASLRFNTRYVNPADADSDTSSGLSIATVNGELSGSSGEDLEWSGTGAINVPLSLVGAVNPTSAVGADYSPSTLSVKPSVPGKPTGVTATAYNAAAVVTWSAPSSGGSAITGYTVTGSNGATCSTNGATTCAFTGLANGTSIAFSVVATNSVGNSGASASSTAVTPQSNSTTLAVPGQPAAPSPTAYSGSARITWSAPTNGPAPIRSYRVTSAPGGITCNLTVTSATTPPLQCDMLGLTNGTSYTFTVVAISAVGESAPSPASAAITPSAGAGSVPSNPPSSTTVYQPTPVVDIDLAGAAASTVFIPGYVSIPQGRFRVNNPNGRDVQFVGGILAAQFDVTDSRGTGPQTVPIGFVEAVVQRIFRIETTTAGREQSIAVVQVNQNGAYAVNSWEVQ